MGTVTAVLVGLALAAPPAAAPVDEAYRAEIRRWRDTREAGLRSERGWLSVAGLFWLKDGFNRMGPGPGHDVALPADVTAKGRIELREGQVNVTFDAGSEGAIAGRPVTSAELRSDASGSPDVLRIGRLSLHLIDRGGRLGIRLRDPEARTRREFKGLDWFEVDEAYRVRARFVPYDTPKPVRVPNVLGQSSSMPSPGYATFALDGREVRLEGVLEEPGAQELFFIFRDETSGKETYPAGRFLYSPLPKDGAVLLDFNKAYNPPCAFTEFATCPLPPPQNWMSVRVPAGEKRYGH
jgi:uncharacterized protein (DUF1684 family)